MTSKDVFLPGYYLRQLTELVGNAGVDTVAWLARAGLTPEGLDEAAVGFSLSGFLLLMEDAVRLTGEPALGLLLGSRLLGNTHGVLSYAALNGGSLRQVLGLLEQFLALRITLVAMSQEEQDGMLRVCFRESVPLGKTRRMGLETVVLSIRNILDFITMGACQVREVAFDFAGSDADARLAAEFCKCGVRYGAGWTGFSLPMAQLDMPLRMADPAAFSEAVEICRRELEKMTRQVSMAARVRRLMLEQQNGFPSLQMVARLFHLTPRTLHRRLIEEGTSFKQVLEEVRHRLALEHLKSGRLSIQEIAFLLGYSDVANFRRAFKRWEGVAPSGVRAVSG
ncbi:AraC family transcriptional regulator [Fluviicoccus keumensis]|uniref:AraC family transcriptional regulator n=1 Tax=Fluviicoccus keumensis TaxID=1435465 RepID=A0A4Q7ZBM3_9GAMM|nr:AraC family transcriptional regulator [Fluviicoccus keumensis]RZU47239.1 AraC family transcriptional regulator [Fluviicoccus keumensis]